MSDPTSELRIIDDIAKYGTRMIEFAHVDNSTVPPTRSVFFCLTPDAAERLAISIREVAELARSQDGHLLGS